MSGALLIGVCALLAVSAWRFARWMLAQVAVLTSDRPCEHINDAVTSVDYLRHELWCARSEAYRWKCRALRLGWRRDEKRWDR